MSASTEGTTGLYLGRFAPLHAGHEHALATALAAVDDLVVLVGRRAGATAPLGVRADWVRDRCPEADVVEGWLCPPEEALRDPETARDYAATVREVLDGRAVDVCYASAAGERLSAALDAAHREVDPDAEIPTTGAAIRRDAYANRAYVPDRVYRDLVTNVVFLGGPSTGKTTLATALADEYDTQWAPEYLREYWAENHVDRELTREQLVEVAVGHRRQEDELLAEADEYLFTDTNAISTLLYGRHYHGGAADRVRELARDCRSRYGLVFVCDTDIPYEASVQRSGAANRERIQRMTLDYLDRHNLPYVLVSGDLDERIARVKRVLDAFEPGDAHHILDSATDDPVP